jgi:hypothetical protein
MIVVSYGTRRKEIKLTNWEKKSDGVERLLM